MREAPQNVIPAQPGWRLTNGAVSWPVVAWFPQMLHDDLPLLPIILQERVPTLVPRDEIERVPMWVLAPEDEAEIPMGTSSEGGQ